MDLVRLACVRHAASVRPEPGSNSPSRIWRPERPTAPAELEPRDRPVASIRRAGSGWLPLPNWHRHESITGVMFPNLCIELLMGRPCRSKPSAGSPTLALWCVLSSVVKERTPPTGSGKVSAGTHRRPRGFGELVPACSPPVSVVTGSVGRRKTIGTCPARVNPRSARGGDRAVHGAAARTDRGPDRPS